MKRLRRIVLCSSTEPTYPRLEPPEARHEIHVILGAEGDAQRHNRNTHKPKHDRWLKRHRNVHCHFTPTRASRLNPVEIRFSIPASKALDGASFNSRAQLKAHITAFIESYNTTAKPFAWTKTEAHQKRLKPRFADQ